MTWDDFYDRYCDWTEATMKTRISSLEDIGNGEDVVDVCLNISDERIKAQLIRKAMKLGVVFTHDDFMNLDGELPDDLFEEVGKYAGFYSSNPYFNEHDFTWDDFYNECSDLPADMILRCVPRITEFGDSEEVKDAINWIFDSDAADALYERAITCGVKFTEEQQEEMGRSERLFIVDDIKEFNNASEDVFEELGRTAHEAADSINAPAEQIERNKRQQKRSKFWGILLGIGAGLSNSSSKKHKHNGMCDGDCDNCPAHYGYRYGRWYYGHGHQRGCEFHGNGGRTGKTYRD